MATAPHEEAEATTPLRLRIHHVDDVYTFLRENEALLQADAHLDLVLEPATPSFATTSISSEGESLGGGGDNDVNDVNNDSPGSQSRFQLHEDRDGRLSEHFTDHLDCIYEELRLVHEKLRIQNELLREREKSLVERELRIAQQEEEQQARYHADLECAISRLDAEHSQEQHHLLERVRAVVGTLRQQVQAANGIAAENATLRSQIAEIKSERAALASSLELARGERRQAKRMARKLLERVRDLERQSTAATPVSISTSPEEDSPRVPVSTVHCASGLPPPPPLPPSFSSQPPSTRTLVDRNSDQACHLLGIPAALPLPKLLSLLHKMMDDILSRELSMQRLYMDFLWTCVSTNHNAIAGGNSTSHTIHRLVSDISEGRGIRSHDLTIRLLSTMIVLLYSKLTIQLCDALESLRKDLSVEGALPLFFLHEGLCCVVRHLASPNKAILGPAAEVLVLLSADGPTYTYFRNACMEKTVFQVFPTALTATDEKGVHECLAVVLEKLSRMRSSHRFFHGSGALMGRLLEIYHQTPAGTFLATRVRSLLYNLRVKP